MGALGGDRGRAGRPRIRGGRSTGHAATRLAAALGHVRRHLLVLCLALGGLLLCSAPALALSQRGHVPAFSFGGSGEGAGQFRFGGTFKQSEPAGIAVNELTGNVYVVDRGNLRVQEFGPEGHFISAWGWGVADGKAEYEVCTSACRAGIAGGGKGQFKEPGPIAVDNTLGGLNTVYVGVNGSAKHPDVQRFTPAGDKPLGKLAMEEEGRLDGLATDLQGRVWLYRGEEEESGAIEGFTDASPPVKVEPSLSSPVACPKPGFGVDAGAATFYVDHELLTSEAECPAVLERELAEEKEPAEGKFARPVVAAKLVAEEVLSDGGVAISQLDRQNTTGIAVDQGSAEGTPLGAAALGDVYVDGASSVSVLDASGQLVQSFGAGVLKEGMGVAVNSKTGDVYVLDAGEQKVQVFEPEQAAKPAIEDLSARNLSPTEVLLSAKIDPKGSDTHYYFQYGTVDCVSDPSGCTDVPAAPGTDIGAGFGSQLVSVALQGLTPSTTYHYRVIATSAAGPAEGEQVQATFSTLPSAEGLLADGRAWEMVSPPEKDGSGIEPFGKEGSLIQASADGNAITYVANGPVLAEPGGNRSPEPTQILSTRSPGAWASQELVTPHQKGEGLEAGEPAAYRFFSEDLALSLIEPPGGQVEPLEAPPLAPGATEKTLYLRADTPVTPSPPEQPAYSSAQANSGFLAPGYAPLVTSLNANGAAFGGKLGFLAATSDLGHVLFESEVPLAGGSAPGLYETTPDGALALMSVLPDGTPASEPALGDENVNVRNAVSNDGSRVVFWAEIEEGESHGLYLRDATKKETLQINAAKGVTEPTGEESEVGFQAATSDGSKVFFTDTAPLTPESTQRQAREADLYECDVIEEAGKLACDLKDLTPLPSGGSADVLNVIPGISADGSSVYFVANGVLAPGAKPGHCIHQSEEVPPPGASCNLYLRHDGETSLIAELSNEDSGDWGSLHGSGRVGSFIENRPDLTDVSSRVSPNGEYLAFMSDMPLTGYDNTDANHAGVRDQEVYLYQASTHLLSCASCNRSGPSTGVLDTPLSGEGSGLLVDRREDWSGQYLAGSVPGWTPLGIDGATNQPRYLSDNGRLFFNSPDPLAPQATNAKQDVYEYEPQNLGSCDQQNGCVSLISSGTAKQESAFLDASEGGDDAFFITAQPLVAADQDTNYDLYDARVCTSSSPCISSEETSLKTCESTGTCKAPGTPPPTFSSPPSASPQGQQSAAKGPPPPPPLPKPGGKPKHLTRAQLLARALKACRKDKNRHKRQLCEKQARKHYAPAKAKKSTRSKHRKHR